MATTTGLILGVLTLCFIVGEVELCSCFYSHPQEHYCVADFVAVVRVKSQGKGDSGITAYHIKVKKEFKMTEKARHALSQGLIWTSSNEAACGVTLQPTRYLIAGRIRGEKPFVSLCHFVQEWAKLSPSKRKDFVNFTNKDAAVEFVCRVSLRTAENPTALGKPSLAKMIVKLCTRYAFQLRKPLMVQTNVLG